MNPMILVYTGVFLLVVLWVATLIGFIARIADGEDDGIIGMFTFLLVTAVILLVVGGVWASYSPTKSTMPEALKETFERGYDTNKEAPTKAPP